MASSFIDFKDNGFWARDGFVEAFQLLLFEEIRIIYNDSSDWLNEYKKELSLQSLPLIHGGMSMRLDETLIDNSRNETILHLLDNIKEKISKDKDYLTGKHLNRLRRTVRKYLIGVNEITMTEKEIEKDILDGCYGDELPVNNYQRGFDLLRNLIAGQLKYKVDTEITYWDE